MRSSHHRIVSRLRTTFSHTPFYRPLRFLYNTLFLVGATRTVEVNGLRIQFLTPTFRIVDDLEALAERDLLTLFLNAIREGDIVWDVGANFGLYTLFAARTVGNRGRVVAFEPEPKTRALLARNVALNGVENVLIADCALDKEDGAKDLYASASPNPGTHSLVQRTDYPVRHAGIVVQTLRGDSFVRLGKSAAPQLLKIDVEGSEVNVMRGMEGLLPSPDLRAMLVEVHPNVLPLFGCNAGDIEALLHSGGLKVVERVDRGGEFHLFAARA